MAAEPERHPLIVILGQTASGKSELAIEMATRFNGEIISADSRAIYKNMDIGTAKPNLAARKRIKHHLIDVVYPDQPFNVSDYKKLAEEAIVNVQEKGKIPFLVGGTGLYIDSVLYNFSFRPKASAAIRDQLETRTVAQLKDIIFGSGLDLPNNPENRRHLIRTVEAGGVPSKCSVIRPDTLIIGIQLSPEELKDRITHRIYDMINAGLVDEIKLLTSQYGWDLPSMQLPNYKALRPFIEKQQPLSQVINQAITKERQYSKRQAVWFKRNKSIHWVNQQIEVVDIITTFLNK
jgi:tRNA dimethylallyltransferase